MTRAQELPRDKDGKLSKYAWPGGYPVSYLMGDGELICADCARGENGSDASPDADDKQWQIVAGDVIWEYEDCAPTCAHCEAEIETAYGHACDDGCRSNGCTTRSI